MVGESPPWTPSIPPVKAFLPLANESRVKFGEPFEIEMWGAVIVGVAAIGLATGNGTQAFLDG
jgi:hypothetical protein